jgi:hypothetical protein
VAAVAAAGGVNHVQGGYYRHVAEFVMTEPAEFLESIKPVIRIGDSKAWVDALRLAIAFLKRYKMADTVATLRVEAPNAPKQTGYGRASEVDSAFGGLLDVATDLASFAFDDRVTTFAEELDSSVADADQDSQQKQESPKKKR